MDLLVNQSVTNRRVLPLHKSAGRAEFVTESPIAVIARARNPKDETKIEVK
jgi:hypothetical protein